MGKTLCLLVSCVTPNPASFLLNFLHSCKSSSESFFLLENIFFYPPFVYKLFLSYICFRNIHKFAFSLSNFFVFLTLSCHPVLHLLIPSLEMIFKCLQLNTALKWKHTLYCTKWRTAGIILSFQHKFTRVRDGSRIFKSLLYVVDLTRRPGARLIPTKTVLIQKSASVFFEVVQHFHSP